MNMGKLRNKETWEMRNLENGKRKKWEMRKSRNLEMWEIGHRNVRYRVQNVGNKKWGKWEMRN